MKKINRITKGFWLILFCLGSMPVLAVDSSVQNPSGPAPAVGNAEGIGGGDPMDIKLKVAALNIALMFAERHSTGRILCPFFQPIGFNFMHLISPWLKDT